MYPAAALLLLFPLTSGLYVQRPSEDQDHDPQTRWAASAVEFVRNLRCQEVVFTSERSCRALTKVPRSEMNLYIAENDGRRVLMIGPEGPLHRGGRAVVVIDPYPDASFGHLVLVFVVDVGLTRVQCQLAGGRYTGNRECLMPVVKNQCQNLLLDSGIKHRRRNVGRKCEIIFIPLVYRAEKDQPNQEDQLLRCVDNIPGFRTCRSLRTINETKSIMCDPLNVNHHRCSVTHDSVRTRCRLLERCDHAVLLSGGWNRDHSLLLYKNNLKAMYKMLKSNGFPTDNIKTFFANGGHALDVLEEENIFLYPSAFKLAIRNHIKRLCQSPKCVDTLVLYMNSPTLHDGTTLLWDTDNNGQIDETETYSIAELLLDLQDCTAERVIVLADQSYSGEIVQAFQRSWRHRMVRVFASGRDQEYSWNGEFTNHWTSFRHTHSCVGYVQEASELAVRWSTPTASESAMEDRTIFGAPCNAHPPYDPEELNQQFYGCQNLPSGSWIAGV